MRVMNEEKLKKMETYIKDYIADHNGIAPPLTEIFTFMEMNKQTAYRYLLELANRGIIHYSGKNTLSLPNQKKYTASSRRIVIRGSIPCGEPDDYYREDIQGHIAIPTEWIDGDCYLLRATGDSMIDIGIDDGDLVLVKVATEAIDNQVIVALTEDGPTLKRYHCEDGHHWLVAENKTYPDNRRYLHPEMIRVQGIVLKIIKNVK